MNGQSRAGSLRPTSNTTGLAPNCLAYALVVARTGEFRIVVVGLADLPNNSLGAQGCGGYEGQKNH